MAVSTSWAEMPAAAQRAGVELHAHRRRLAAVDLHPADTLHLRQALRQHGVGCIVDLATRERVGGQGDA